MDVLILIIHCCQ